MISTRLPLASAAMANHTAHEPVGDAQFHLGLGVARTGARGDELIADAWDSMRHLSPGALAACVAAG